PTGFSTLSLHDALPISQRQVVARLDVRVRTRLDPVALLEVLRAEDVALLTVHVVEQRDAGGPVRVVLDVRDLGRHAVLVHPLEVDRKSTRLNSSHVKIS